MSLSAIEVYGDYVRSLVPKLDLDQSTVTQSSTDSGLPAKNAFTSSSTSYSKTKSSMVGEWWKVYFKHRSTVKFVKVRSNGSNYNNRLSGVKVYIDNNYCG